MKKLFSISLMIAVLLASMSEAAIYVAFKVNQSAIVQNYCINKNAPEKACHGKCFLADRLAENEGDGQNSTPSSIFEQAVKINFFPTASDFSKDCAEDKNTLDNIPTQHLLSQSYFASLLRPPQFS